MDAGGYSFAINYSQDRAEVTRLTRVWRPDYADVQAAAVALLRMKIDCSDGAKIAPPPPSNGPKTSCLGNLIPFDLSTGVFDLAIDCD